MDLLSQLPIEVEEHVLSFVPAPNLCWNRSVCKRWNRIISDPFFAARCVQNQSKEHAPSLILHYSPRELSEAWRKYGQQFCILDLRARRWYQHSDAQGAPSLLHRYFDRIVHDMDGGLVLCEYWATEGQRSAMVVYNPLEKTEEEVPIAPDYSSSICLCPLLSLVVDNIAQTFTIFSLDDEFGERSKDGPALQIYNSATKEWKGLTNQWCKRETEFGDEQFARPESMVMFQQCLYVLFEHFSRTRRYYTFQIWRYDLLKDLWENVSILMDTCKRLPSGKLIVSANRLFIVGWSKPIQLHLHQFEVTEISIRQMTCETLFTWTKVQALEVFDLEDDGKDCRLRIKVFGFDNSLMFMHNGSPRKLIAFDLVTRKWDCEWPRHPLEHQLPCDGLWMGKQMNFLLPGTPW